MATILQPVERKKSVAQRLIGGGLGLAESMLQEKGRLASAENEDEQLKNITGVNFAGIKDKDLRKALITEALQGKNKLDLETAKNKNDQAFLDKTIGNSESSGSQDEVDWSKIPDNKLIALKANKKFAPMVTAELTRRNRGGIGSKEVPKDIRDAISKTIKDNPNTSAEQLELALMDAGVPSSYSKEILESRRRAEEKRTAELIPMKQDIAAKADAAAQSLASKERQIDIINRGDLNDPTFATIMESLPGKLGQRFLSNDTVEYKASLVDEYRDLKSIFSGATRVAELEILQKKIADTYYTDEQKKAIIKARIKATEMDLAKAELASQIDKEKPNLGVLEFTTELNKKMKEKTQYIADQVIDELENVQSQAEITKSRPLDVSNPNDASIMRQIYQEAGGDIKEAYKLAEKKGYKVKK